MPGADFDDTTDFDDAHRGFVAALDPGVVRAADGRVVWDNDAFGFLDGPCPDTAHPSLWRQSQLTAVQGLFEVTEGIYQVRGLDLSNMTLVESDRGVIVIDPLISSECAAAALALYRAHRGERPVTGIIYSHAHVDHFGGARGVYEEGVPVVAGEGFMASAVSENVYAGPAMSRRAVFMYGPLLPKGPEGLVGTGLGQTNSTGTIGIIPPTLEITRTGQEEVIDGVRIVFQMTPGTECPVEMNFVFPDHRALCMAENATHNLHNVVTLRGALVRDARIWARYLDEAIDRFCGDVDVAFASHHWPTWGHDRIVTYLSQQRDLYAYLHDQTLRLMNQGHTGIEIAERLEMPPALDAAWHTHGYYGSVSHNVKAVYQRYLGWFDGHPSSLWEHPPEASATRYVACMGGIDEVVAKARTYADDGDLRFAAQLLKHAVFAEAEHPGARELLADVYRRLGYGAENGTWRNFYLQGARELLEGVPAQVAQTAGSAELIAALSVEQLFDSIAIRIDGTACWEDAFAIDWVFADLGERWRTTLSNGVLTPRLEPRRGTADLTVTLTKPAFLGLLAGAVSGRPADVAEITFDGDASVVGRLLAAVDRPDPNFAIVTP